MAPARLDATGGVHGTGDDFARPAGPVAERVMASERGTEAQFQPRTLIWQRGERANL